MLCRIRFALREEFQLSSKRTDTQDHVNWGPRNHTLCITGSDIHYEVEVMIDGSFDKNSLEGDAAWIIGKGHRSGMAEGQKIKALSAVQTELYA